MRIHSAALGKYYSRHPQHQVYKYKAHFVRHTVVTQHLQNIKIFLSMVNEKSSELLTGFIKQFDPNY